ncbi:polyphosphate polymerase domain-containing protein [Sutcliffiella deserti]|uniref:polyphosphate polymerase domain-containing protein n=1 Tax=Sutcliffiella deserti TaxID=2875501 RepID=UPI001CBAEEDF|nr:polyphosphate polymerase domain-containing protein [Sutcliffiella deserti]
MAKEIFTRYELKYLIPNEVYLKLAEAILPYTRFDSFGEEGKYNIVSLYFDSPNNDIYYETRNKLFFRQKLRLRVYDKVTRTDSAFFEIKQKYKNVVNKRRTKISLQDAYRYLDQEGSSLPTNLAISNPQIMNEVHSFRNLYKLKPEVVVSYDRQAFQGIYDDDLRITFDFNLTCRSQDLHIENGSYGTHFVEPGLVILEVKVTHSVPLWLSRLLSDLECPRKSVSKFCTSIDLMTEEKSKGGIFL